MTIRFSFAGRKIELRPVVLDDAALILRLRADAAAMGALNPGATSEAAQRAWLEEYARRNQAGTDFYYIVNHRGLPVGAIRIYQVDRATGSFAWGSWVMAKGTEAVVAWLSAIAIYDQAFDRLGLTVARFEVVARNANVVRFHRGFGATVVGQTESLVAFSLTKEQYQQVRGRFLQRIASIGSAT